MTDKEKIREYLIGMANAECCNKQTAKDIKNVIIPYIDSMQEESDLNWKDMSLQEKKDLVAKLSEDIRKEEPTASVWHDKSEKPKMNSIIVVNNDQTTLSVEYVGQSLCGVERWAYLDNLLKL